MKIRTQFTLIFALVVGVILFFFSFSIFYLSENFRITDFKIRLEDKAVNRLKLLLATASGRDSLQMSANELWTLQSEGDFNTAIFQTNGHLLYRDRQATVPSKALLDRIASEKSVFIAVNGVEYLGFIYNFQGADYLLVASGHDQYGTKYLNNLKKILIVRGSIIFIVIFISGWLYAGRFLRPISKIVHQVEKISSSSLNQRLLADNKLDEIGQLTNTFNKMLERLETSFNIQKRFVSNASHELRNPLTAIGGQIEVALMKDRQTDDYKAVLHTILKEIKNLRTLSNNLLELANSDVETLFRHFQPIRIDEILWAIRDELALNKPEYEVHISFNMITDDENMLTCKGEEKLLKIAFVNVIDNACKFSSDKTVEINVVLDHGSIVLYFADKGIGMPESYLKHVFEPFYRGINARGTPGNGIGLSLVEKIIKLHSGKIFLRSKLNEGTTVEIVLPNLS
ncbi:MAG: HAMP domain-containing histidine kinase [Bacteroidetes bacterium]|nr:HAMP domain-containing histidine kinase [Bacteroidota bacterium]